MTESTPSTPSWYAAKIYAEKKLILKYLESEHIATYIPMIGAKPVVASLVFIHCPANTIAAIKDAWFYQMAVYKDAERNAYQAISDKEMENFRMVMNIRNLECIPVEVKDPSFFMGQKVRVLYGPLKGAEGIIKRIKGDRRLVVAVTGVVAVATTYIRPDLLEPIQG